MRDKVDRIGDAREPFWPPHAATRFALLGKIDINRDKKDDRDELKRMIKQAGGLVEFDLPPPEVGKETGTLSPRIDWYVTDSVDDRRSEPDQFAKRLGLVIKEARLNGTRPMRVERLLDYLRRP